MSSKHRKPYQNLQNIENFKASSRYLKQRRPTYYKERKSSKGFLNFNFFKNIETSRIVH